MRLMIGDRVLPFVVRGILKNEGPARVLDGNFIMMDIAAAQLAFDRLGRVDRIDVLLPGRRRPASRSRRDRHAAAGRRCRRNGRHGAASRSRPCWRRFTPT